MGALSRITRMAGTLVPAVDEWAFTRDREALLAASSAGYESRLSRLAAPTVAAELRPTKVVVIPQNGSDAENWVPGGGNFLFEIAQSAREFLGDGAVEIFDVPFEEDPADWHVRLIEMLIDTGATHVLAQIEADPHRTAERWTWDILWSHLHRHWDGVLLGLTFDSSWRWLQAQSRRLARISDHFLLVDICMPMDGVLVRGRAEVGPVNMPISGASLDVIDAFVGDVEQDIDVSFIGSLYPDRLAFLSALSDSGLQVSVNPHRQSVELTLEGSRADLPGYAAYMQALARSKMTINVAKSSAGPYLQLKTRVLEAAAMGSLVLTDDIDRTSRFWLEGRDYEYFSSPQELADIVRAYLADPDRLRAAQASARRIAREIHVSSFWGGIDSGLRQRGLPPLRRVQTQD